MAVKPSADALSALDRVLRDETGARPSVAGLRWLDPSRWHVTLKFLGDVPEARIGDVRAACAGAVGRVPPFVASLSGAGAFPSRRRARVLWVGVSEGADRFATLAGEVQAETAERGFPPDRREFQAHFTVARFRGRSDATLVVDQVGRLLEGGAGIASEVGEIALVESHLDPGGARYDLLDTFPLRGPVPGNP